GIGRDLPPAEAAPAGEEAGPPPEPQRYTLEVNGKRFAVRLIDHNGADGARPAPARAGRAPRPAPRRDERGAAAPGHGFPHTGTTARTDGRPPASRRQAPPPSPAKKTSPALVPRYSPTGERLSETSPSR